MGMRRDSLDYIIARAGSDGMVLFEEHVGKNEMSNGKVNRDFVHNRA